MPFLRGDRTEHNVIISISDSEFMDSFHKFLFKGNEIRNVCLHDGKVCYYEDVSRHGSPYYEYKELHIPAEVYESFRTIYKYYRDNSNQNGELVHDSNKYQCDQDCLYIGSCPRKKRFLNKDKDYEFSVVCSNYVCEDK